MQNYKAQLELGLGGNISAQCARFSQDFAGLAKSGRQSLGTLGTYAQKTENVLGRVFNRTTAVLTGVGLGVSGGRLSEMQLRLTRLRLQAGVSKEAMEKLNKEIFSTAQNRDINIDPSQLVAAVEKIVGKTGNLDFAARNLKNLAYAISATGAAGEDVGAMGADLLEKFGIDKEKDIISTLGLLVNQGKAGAFELKDLATQGERVTAAYASTGRQGKIAVTEMGAMLQMARKATGGPEQTATALEALIRNLNDPQKRKLLTEAGIKIMDPEDPKRMRSVVDISKDLIKLTKGDASKIGRVIDQEGMRALMAMLIEFKQTGGFKSVDEFLSTSSDPQNLLDDSKEVAQTLSSAMTSLRTASYVFASTHLAVPIQKLADAINSLSPEQVQKIFEYGSKAAMALAAVWAGSKVFGAGARLLGSLGSGTKGKVLGGLAAFTNANPMPVWVVNSGGAALSGFNNRFKRKAGLGGALAESTGGSLFKNSWRNLGRIGGVGAIGLGGIEALTADNANEMGQGIGTSIGGAIGMLGGPIGVVIGSCLGRYFGGKVGNLVEEIEKAESSEEIGKSIGRRIGKTLDWLAGDIGEKTHLGQRYAESGGAWVGRLFDDYKSDEARQAKQQAEAMKPVLQNTFHFTIDKDGMPHLERQQGDSEQTKIDFDIGYTRMSGYEA